MSSFAAREIPRPALVIAGCALVLALLSVLRAVLGGGAEALIVPLLLAIGQFGSALALVRRVAGARLLAGALLFLTGLLHLVVALGEADWWVRLISALVLAASVYAAILLITRRPGAGKGSAAA